MLAVAFRFFAGRYHATPWGRHVNEADVEWPPSPWRIMRSLIAVRYRKLDPVEYPLEILENLLIRLSESLPVYRLPPAVHSHARHYMPVREGSKDKSTLVFDAFAKVSPEDELIVSWPNLELDAQATGFLDGLLAALGYLGRAESWVQAYRLPRWDGSPNCVPEDPAGSFPSQGTDEAVSLLCPLTPSAYADLLKQRKEEDPGPKTGRKGRSRTGKSSLPPSWLDAVCLETSELQNAGWSHPPAARRVWYRRPMDALLPSAVRATPAPRRSSPVVTTVRFALYGRPLPMMEDAVRIGELARSALMGVVERQLGEIPKLLSGHGLGPGDRHPHAFFLSEPDRNGRVDHLLLHVSGGLDRDTLQAVGQLKRLYTRDGREWQVWFEGAGTVEDFHKVSLYTKPAEVWRSLTPYLHPWHVKRGFGISEQLRRECRLRRLPEPEDIRFLPEVMVGSRPRRPVHFHRFRNKRGLIQADTRGCFAELVFPEPILGPLALGFGCHYGLGLFVPADGSSATQAQLSCGFGPA